MLPLFPNEAYRGLLEGGCVGADVAVGVNVAVLVAVFVGVGEGPAVGVFVGAKVFVLVAVGGGVPMETSHVLPSFSVELVLLSTPRLTI